MIEKAVATYIRMWNERDPEARRSLIDACWAANGRFVTRSGAHVGRDALAKLAVGALANVEAIRVLAVDARGTTFRLHAIADLADGTSAEAFEAGEIDDDGRIAVVLTFAGPLLPG